MKVVDAVDALVVAREGKVGRHHAQPPDLDGVVQRAGGKGVGVLGVEDDLHDVVRVALKDMRALPVGLPVPHLDCHVVRTREDVGLAEEEGDD